MAIKVDDELMEKFEDIANQVGGRLREDYSGRGMFGKHCIGIVCENLIECIETAAVEGITGAKFDSMGLQYIVYWPKYIKE